METAQGTLSVVATPIGNLEDITMRALRILRECDYVLCEDTRVTGKLLGHYEISTPRKRYDAHTSDQAHQTIMQDLKAGKHIALVSDAGTPGISDPGVRVVQDARTVGARVETIPGPSALTAAVSIAGISGNRFSFLGYIPQKKGRQSFFTNLISHTEMVVVFESSHRIVRTLEALADTQPDRGLVIARELTKMYEEVRTGTARELLAVLHDEPVKTKGEFVLILQPMD